MAKPKANKANKEKIGQKRNNTSSTSNNSNSANNPSNSRNKPCIWRKWVNNKGTASKRDDRNSKHKRATRYVKGRSIYRWRRNNK